MIFKSATEHWSFQKSDPFCHFRNFHRIFVYIYFLIGLFYFTLLLLFFVLHIWNSQS
uniref:Uncharacterized protein n=1 Tax=Anguilla anguilla TaxID=7936 RepID=A0A0E9RRW6_ANGAN